MFKKTLKKKFSRNFWGTLQIARVCVPPPFFPPKRVVKSFLFAYGPYLYDVLSHIYRLFVMLSKYVLPFFYTP